MYLNKIFIMRLYVSKSLSTVTTETYHASKI
jgi:hypothetical protein